MTHTQNINGGYHSLNSFNLASILHLGTMQFCNRLKDDQGQVGNVADHMVDAARAGKQNVVKGSPSARASAKAQIRSIGYAQSNLVGLQCDLEDYLVKNGELPWSVHADDHRAMCDVRLDPFESTGDILHDHAKYLLAQKSKYDKWLEHQNPVITANALICLAKQVDGLLTQQLKSLENAAVSNESYQRPATRAQVSVGGGDAPQCPQCGTSMKQRNSQKGPFWGCLAFPDCRGTRAM